MGFSRKEYWSGLPFPSPGDLPNPGIGPRFPTLQADALTSEPLDYKECWAPKNWCFWIVVLEKTLENPLNSKEIQPVHPKGNQSWILIGRTDAETETPILWPPDVKSWLTGKDPDDWGQEEKGMTEDEMVRWHQWLNGFEFEQTPVVGDGQGKLGMLQSMGSQRFRPNGTTEPTEPKNVILLYWLYQNLCVKSTCQPFIEVGGQIR